MSIQILMPALSPTMKKGNLYSWIKKDGDYINCGDVIAEIETDKATMEIESADEGILKILLPEGTQDVEVNAVIALLHEEQEQISDEEIKTLLSTKQDAVAPAELDNEKHTLANKNIIPSVCDDDIKALKRTFISPVAKKLAQSEQLDIGQIQGSGPKGRIVKKDVLDYLKIHNSKQNTSDAGLAVRSQAISVVEPTQMQKIIARRLTDSKKNTPHFYVKSELQLDKLLLLRKEINLVHTDKISINDFCVKAVGNAIKKFGIINSYWQEDKIMQLSSIDISVAVSTDDDGILTPVIRDVANKNLINVASDARGLIEKARKNNITPGDCEGGSVTISNLGMYQVEEFVAIINPPQSSIVAIGTAKKKIYVNDNNETKIGTFVTCMISCDHRIINGNIAAMWVNEIKRLIENPLLLLL